MEEDFSRDEFFEKVLKLKPNQRFSIKLNSYAGAGYLLDLDEISSQGFSVINSTSYSHRSDNGEILIGSGYEIIRLVSPNNVCSGSLIINHYRPWLGKTSPITKKIKYEVLNDGDKQSIK